LEVVRRFIAGGPCHDIYVFDVLTSIVLLERL